MKAYSPPPWPKDPRHQRLADLIFEGWKTGDAMALLYPRLAKASRTPQAGKIKRRADYKAYLEWIRAHSTTDATLSAQEKREFFARIVRTPVAKLDPLNPEDTNGDLIKAYTHNESETGTNLRVEKLDPLKAIELDNQLSGDDPESDFFRSLNDALAELSTPSPLPEDTL
jgi:hypothetical protein